MPGIVVDEIHEEGVVNESNQNSIPFKDVANKSPKNNLSPQSRHNEGDHPIDTSIEQLYENVCDMQSSDQSASRASLGSDGEESRIDSELRHLVGGEMREVEIMEEEVAVDKPEIYSPSDSGSVKEGISGNSKKDSSLDIELLSKSSPKSKSPPEKPPRDTNLRKTNVGFPMKKKRTSPLGKVKLQNGNEESSDSGSGNPDLGPFLLKQTRDLISSGEYPKKALELSLRASKSFETCANGKPSLELVMCLHVTAAIHCNLGQYADAIPVLEHSIEIPVIENGQDHALAKFAGHMQLGDTYAMLGQLEKSILSYSSGLDIQRRVLGDTDPRVGETCRYLAEAHVQALQFDEAMKVCQIALDIHRDNGAPTSLEEAADRRLMGLICETKGDHEGALEHLVLASMAMVANGHEIEVASVDCSIGDTYLSLSRYDEAVFAYQKALTSYKSSKGENHPAVASVFIRLADLYNKIGKFREAKSYCESALQIYGKPIQGVTQEEIASGLTDISVIYESMNELQQALKLLEKALKIYNGSPGQQSSIAGIEAQMGVMHYMLENYSESYVSFKSAVSKLRACGEKKSSFFGIALNQMGLACVQCRNIVEATELFEEARSVLEQVRGPYHPDTLGVYSNLAGAYDAVGRVNNAIELLERVVGMREEKLGTANPDVNEEKRRLAELLKESGRVRIRNGRSLENLLDANSRVVNTDRD